MLALNSQMCVEPIVQLRQAKQSQASHHNLMILGNNVTVFYLFFFSVKIWFIYKIRFIRFIILLTIAIIPLILRNVINKPTNDWMNILGPEFPIVWRKIKSHWDLSQTFWQIQIQSSKHLIRFQFPKLVHIYTRYRDRCRASFSHIIIIISIISH